MISSDNDIPVLLAESIKDSMTQQFPTLSVAQKMLPEHDLKQLASLKVFVIPGPLEASELLDRGATVQSDWLVGIAFQKQVKRGDDTETRDILKTIRLVRTWLNKNRVIDLGGELGEYVITDISHKPYIDHELLHRGEFFSVIELSIREWEDID